MSEAVEWLSTDEAAAAVGGVTARTLYRFMNDADLPAYRFGRVIRLRRQDIDDFVESCRLEPGDLDNLTSNDPPE